MKKIKRKKTKKNVGEKCEEFHSNQAQRLTLLASDIL